METEGDLIFAIQNASLGLFHATERRTRDGTTSFAPSLRFSCKQSDSVDFMHDTVQQIDCLVTFIYFIDARRVRRPFAFGIALIPLSSVAFAFSGCFSIRYASAIPA